jgi:hypothetical protein
MNKKNTIVLGVVLTLSTVLVVGQEKEPNDPFASSSFLNCNSYFLIPAHVAP